MSDNMLRSLGSVFKNRALYGPTHNVTIQSLESAFEAISQCLATDPTLLFTITPDECNLNNRPVGQNVPIIGQFIDRLRAHEVSTLTLKRMEKLENQVSHDASQETTEGVEHTQQQSRRQLLELIAEIVQELCQPLSVIQCSFDVLLTGQLEAISTAQQELLAMASRSAKRLDLLIHDLVTIVGHPSDMVPKERTKDIILE